MHLKRTELKNIRAESNEKEKRQAAEGRETKKRTIIPNDLIFIGDMPHALVHL